MVAKKNFYDLIPIFKGWEGDSFERFSHGLLAMIERKFD